VLCGLIGRPDLIDDDRTRSSRDRVEHPQFMRELMCAWTSQRTTAEIVEVLGGFVPVGPVNDAAALFDSSHVRARQMLVAVEHPGMPRPGVLPNTAMRFSRTPAGIYRRPPKLGEHTEEILAELDKEQPS